MEQKKYKILKKCQNCGKMFIPNKYNYTRQNFCGGRKDLSSCVIQNRNAWHRKRWKELIDLEKSKIT